MLLLSDSDLPPEQFWSLLIARIEAHRRQFSGLETTIADEDVWEYFKWLSDLETEAHIRLCEELSRP